MFGGEGGLLRHFCFLSCLMHDASDQCMLRCRYMTPVDLGHVLEDGAHEMTNGTIDAVSNAPMRFAEILDL